MVVDWAASDGGPARSAVRPPRLASSSSSRRAGGWRVALPRARGDRVLPAIWVRRSPHPVRGRTGGAAGRRDVDARRARAYVRTLLFSTVMGYLLHRLGRLALHASVVAWQDRAFAGRGRTRCREVHHRWRPGPAGLPGGRRRLRRTRQGGRRLVRLPGLTGVRLAEAHGRPSASRPTRPPPAGRAPAVGRRRLRATGRQTAVAFAGPEAGGPMPAGGHLPAAASGRWRVRSSGHRGPSGCRGAPRHGPCPHPGLAHGGDRRKTVPFAGRPGAGDAGMDGGASRRPRRAGPAVRCADGRDGRPRR